MTRNRRAIMVLDDREGYAPILRPMPTPQSALIQHRPTPLDEADCMAVADPMACANS